MFLFLILFLVPLMISFALYSWDCITTFSEWKGWIWSTINCRNILLVI
jgi:hypothetical protein